MTRSIIRKNVATHPELAHICVPRLALVYSRHALEACANRGIRELSEIAGACVVETVETELGRLLKLVLRVEHDETRDVVLVVVPRAGKLFVVTTWLNRKDDMHETLNRERISA